MWKSIEKAADDPNRVFTVAIHGGQMDRFVERLKRANDLGVTVIGGSNIDDARVTEATLSLAGSSKALSFIAGQCA